LDRFGEGRPTYDEKDLRFTIQRGENWNMEIAFVDMKKIRVLVEHLDLDEKQEIRT
jgi:hypothetical protein